MTIQHIVAFKYKETTTAETRAQISNGFLALKTDCLTQSGSPYIQKMVSGKQDSVEGMSKGLDHVFLLEFKSETDRKWYVEQDPVHAKFKDLVGPNVDDVVVLDFTEGQF